MLRVGDQALVRHWRISQAAGNQCIQIARGDRSRSGSPSCRHSVIGSNDFLTQVLGGQMAGASAGGDSQ
jgi:hypothetical protein